MNRFCRFFLILWTLSGAANAWAEALQPEVSAQQFVAHINYARVAIAMNDKAVAQQHIRKAQELIGLLRQENMEARKAVHVESGRVVYDYDTDADHKYHYFPVSHRTVEVQKVVKGPFWAKNALAVADADVVYLSLDLRGNDAEKGLAKASRALAQDYFTDADKYLARVTDRVVKVDKQRALPQKVAGDNIALARDFLAMDNFEGAGFALKHADKALEMMESRRDKAGRHDRIIAIRKDIGQLMAQVADKTPGLLQKDGDAMIGWQRELNHLKD